MDVVERVRDPGADHRDAVGRERPALVQDAGEVGAVDELGDEVEAVVLVDEVVDLDDGLVAELRVRAPLPPEPLDDLLRAGELHVERLHGDRAIELLLERLVHDAHATAADLADDPGSSDLAHHRSRRIARRRVRTQVRCDDRPRNSGAGGGATACHP